MTSTTSIAIMPARFALCYHSPPPPTPMGMELPNPCAGKKPYDASPGDGYFNNVNCTSLETLSFTILSKKSCPLGPHEFHLLTRRL